MSSHCHFSAFTNQVLEGPKDYAKLSQLLPVLNQISAWCQHFTPWISLDPFPPLATAGNTFLTSQITWNLQHLIKLMPSVLPLPQWSVVFCLGLILKELTDKHQPVQNGVLPSSSTAGRVVELLTQELQSWATQTKVPKHPERVSGLS